MPKVFVSYSWTSPQHEEWVLNLATSLRESGVDVVLDKWDLREGHDAFQFMEQMVTDQDIEKVILVVDRQYAEKSNSRKGGVGTEAQIISPELYGKREQNKFVAAVVEVDSDGRPFLPVYYKSRIYIDFSIQEYFFEKFEQLVRWVFDKPLLEKPTLGKVPSFVASPPKISIPVSTKAKQAADAIRAGRSNSLPLVQEYLEELSSGITAFRISGGSDPNFDDKVVDSFNDFQVYAHQYLEVLRTLAKHLTDPDATRIIHRFFEALIPYLYRPNEVQSWNEVDFDNYKLCIHQLFLFSVAIFLKHERFDLVSSLTSQDYYVGNISAFNSRASISFEVFRQYPRSMEFRNNRLKLNRVSIQADLIVETAKSLNIPENDVYQADFFLYLRTELEGAERFHRWYPVTLPFMDRLHRPFEVFVRSASKAYFTKMSTALGGVELESLKSLLHEFSTGTRKAPNDGHWTTLDPSTLSNAQLLGTKP